MRTLLVPLSLVHRAVCVAKNGLYNLGLLKPRKAPLPVISVGNIAFGGSEKTPLCMALLSFLLDSGMRPALVTRGYKGLWEKQGGLLSDGTQLHGTWKEAGDEPIMVARKCPRAGVLIGKDRLDSCIQASRLGFDVAVLDDGFQHRCLHRDLDIVLHDPAVRTALREPVAALGRAEIILVRKSQTAGQAQLRIRIPNQAQVFAYEVQPESLVRLRNGQAEPLTLLQDKRVLAFCGIARPERFRASLERAGISPLDILSFADHHPYPSRSTTKIAKKALGLNADAIVTTEKDAVKMGDLDALSRIPVFYLKIRLEVDDGFDSVILNLIHKTQHS